MVRSEVGALSRVLLMRPVDAWVSQARVAREWRALGYLSEPDLGKAQEQHDRLAELLSESGVEMEYLPPHDALSLDAVYVRDASVASGAGLVTGRMGKPTREPEAGHQGRVLCELGVPILGAVQHPGCLEGGDVVWVDERTVAVGLGYRTDVDGAGQLRDLLSNQVDHWLEVPLPHWKGPDDVFHLMSMVSPIDHDLWLVYSCLLPVPFRNLLLDRGIELIEVAEHEFESLGCNVLTVAPRKCIMISGNPETRERLERAGARVAVFDGGELCLKGQGGPTCLVRPLGRVSA